MRRTKWWLGLLDYMGFGNFVGPEELENLVGNETLMRQMNEYNQTDALNKMPNTISLEMLSKDKHNQPLLIQVWEC